MKSNKFCCFDLDVIKTNYIKPNGNVKFAAVICSIEGDGNDNLTLVFNENI